MEPDATPRRPSRPSLLLATAACAADWEKVAEIDGILIERRIVSPSCVSEIRATAHSPLRSATIFGTIWKHHEYLEFVPYLKRLKLLSDTGDERVAYEQLALPLVGARDYTVRFRRRVDAETHRYEISMDVANNPGPPADGNHVRVTHIRGGWTVEPGPAGKGSLVRYEMQSDPGGRTTT